MPDHDRPLSERGREAAPLVARYMADEGLKPSLAIVSSALRARETFEYFRDAVGEATVRIEPQVYSADVDDLISLLRNVPPVLDSVLLIGHNPTMQDLALTLAASGTGLESARTKFPTAALAILDVEVDDWSGLGPGAATMAGFVTPKTLQG